MIQLPARASSLGQSTSGRRNEEVVLDVIKVSRFYDARDGNNYQPAFQAALDEAAKEGIPNIVNDFGAITGEMWCPTIRGRVGRGTDGIPLVVTAPVNLDFAGATFYLKGPTGGDRMLGQRVSGFDQPYLGGWLYVVGYPGFGRIGISNVTVDGGFSGSVATLSESNLSDKGFRIQDTEVGEAYLYNVELRNFAGEIYYIGGLGPSYQYLENCHFHGSPQCAFNPGGVGKLKAVNLRAGRAYQAAEVIGGRGHTYVGGHFYEVGNGGSTFFGGPSPSFKAGYPYYYAHWDGVGDRPWVEFQGTRFEGALLLGAWMRGNVVVTDGGLALLDGVGHLRDIDLEVEVRCDRSSGIEAVGLNGPRNLTTVVAGAPSGTFIQKPSRIRLKVHCVRSSEAIANGRSSATGVRFYGGLLDSDSIAIEVSGEARSAYEIFPNPADGFTLPIVIENGFKAV